MGPEYAVWAEGLQYSGSFLTPCYRVPEEALAQHPLAVQMVYNQGYHLYLPIKPRFFQMKFGNFN